MKIKQHIETDICIFCFQGNITKEELRNTTDDIYQKLADDSLQGWIFNFEKVNFVDSSGLGWIVTQLKSLRRRHHSLSVCHVNSTIQELLHMTGVDAFLTLCKTEKEALEKLKKKGTEGTS